MSSEKQVAANRRNGLKSQGPRTAAGKGVSSRNALRHGLATISRDNPAFTARVEAIAKGICPDIHNPMLFEQALIIGETTCVLASVRAERTARTERLIEDNAPSPRRLPCSSGVAELDPLYRYERRALSRRNRAFQTLMKISNTI
jgi:hypothetical protein